MQYCMKSDNVDVILHYTFSVPSLAICWKFYKFCIIQAGCICPKNLAALLQRLSSESNLPFTRIQHYER